MHRFCSLALSLSLLLLTIALTGCAQEPFPEIIAEHDPLVLPDDITPLATGGVIGKSIQGRSITETVLGSGPDICLFLGTIHGNEPAGTPLCRRLAAHLTANPDLLVGRTVVIVPVANPDGFAANTRYNARGIDINRNFEAANRVASDRNGTVALSEPESRIIKAIIDRHHPDRIVALHQPLVCIDYDGPAGALAAHMGRYCNLPVKKLGARPGSLGSYAGVTLGTPIVTFEMPPGTPDSDTLWRLYGKAMLAAVAYPQAAK